MGYPICCGREVKFYWRCRDRTFRQHKIRLLRSIDRAREQSAPSWELRAAVPLARLWARQGRSSEARSLLQGIYQQFTEGFETRDLVAARLLLEDLGAMS